MKRVVATVLAFLVAAPAFAECYPPPGLPIQQWYGMCASTLQQAYGQGMGQGMPFDAFVMAVYQRYAYASAGPQMPQMPMGQQPVAGQCQLGQYQCFSGWARTCQQVGVSTMWITGAQRC